MKLTLAVQTPPAFGDGLGRESGGIVIAATSGHLRTEHPAKTSGSPIADPAEHQPQA